ncbi:hypothetical protein V6Z11_D06G208100 [Gossypium hirsutum]
MVVARQPRRKVRDCRSSWSVRREEKGWFRNVRRSDLLERVVGAVAALRRMHLGFRCFGVWVIGPRLVVLLYWAMSCFVRAWVIFVCFYYFKSSGKRAITSLILNIFFFTQRNKQSNEKKKNKKH